ncbi:hypothetical protein B7494_g1202 [Chlorociboria aeruginascens]|nr:hypothetical protein B7494_g1202 [Chlorociboria aeruginascens]
MPNKPTDFRSTIVKLFLQDKEDSQSPTALSIAAFLLINAPAKELSTRDPAAESIKPTVLLPRQRGQPRNNTIPVLPADISIYLENDLILLPESLSKSPTKSLLTKVPLDDVPFGTRIFNSRFIDEVKHAGTSSAFEKLRLVVQAYNDNELNRNFYVRPPKKLELANGTILKVIKPLYGIPEAGNHWFKTYHQHYTDDTFFIGDITFAASEQSKLKFQAKDQEILTTDHPLKFNGGLITLYANYISTRDVTRKSLTPKDQYVAQRAKGAYIATVCQPKAAFNLSFAAQLDRSILQLIAFTDASFANNKDLFSQIGYVIVLADGESKCNIIHWSSIKCKRVTKSVLASELYRMAHGFDIAAILKSTIEKTLGITLPLVLCTDSKSLYNCLVKLGTTQEKRLMIDLMCLRQSYERREIAKIK